MLMSERSRVYLLEEAPKQELKSREADISYIIVIFVKHISNINSNHIAHPHHIFYLKHSLISQLLMIHNQRQLSV